MEITLSVVIGIIIVGCVLLFLWEYRIRQPDVLVLYESKDQISIRKGPIYPRHFSLPLKRTTCPIQLTVEATVSGDLGMRVKLVGSFAPSVKHVQALIRVGGWDQEAVSRATKEAQVLLEGMLKEYTERFEIHALSSTNILNYLNERSTLIDEKFGVELISLTIQSLEPTDPEIADALRRQQQASLLEETERMSHEARVAAAKAKYQADEEIAEREHDLEMKKAGLKQILLEKESALARQRLEDELVRNRMRLAFEKEGLEVLQSSPELLMLTPQAARLAEASQSLKNARTVISLSPQDLDHGSELLGFFQNLLQKALEAKKGT
ncbi:MAG: hypothetical protein WCA79_17845 [Anaerolineales bacterium]